MEQRDIILGGIALAVGLLIGLLFGPRGPGTDDIQEALDERLAAIEGASAGANEGVAALQTRLDEAVTALQTQADETSSAMQSEIAALGERLGAVEAAVDETSQAQSSSAENLRSELSGRLDALDTAISEQSESVQSRLAGLGQTISSGLSGAQEATADAASAEASAAPAAPVEADPNFVGIGPGQSAVFSDGGLRAFVSRVDPQTGVARLSVNGEIVEMAAGDTAEVTTEDGTDCHLMLSDLQGSQVALNAECGGDLPEPEGIQTGGTMVFAEGAVRVFVSSVADDGNSARLAVNGIQTQTVEVGQSVDVTADDQTCQVTLDNIDRGHVALSTDCGG